LIAQDFCYNFYFNMSMNLFPLSGMCEACKRKAR